MIEFKTISWKNFLSTGNSANKVILNKSRSTLILGKNGEGKSTILDALCFSLFGKPFRNINKPQLINSINQKNCVVEIEFTIGKNNYKVVRGMKPTVFQIYQNDQLMNQDAAAKDYQKVLEQQILKLNYKTFTQVVILGSASFVPFMQLPANQRREVIEDILDIRVFSSMNQILRDKIQQTKEELIRVENNIKVAKTAVESQQKIISNLVSSKQEQIDKIKQRIRENESFIEQNNTRITELINRVAELNLSIADNKTVSSDIVKCDSIYKKRLNKSIDLKETLDFFSNNEVCPSCEQGIAHEHKSTIVGKLIEEREKVDEERYTLETALEKLHTRLAEIESTTVEITTLNNEVLTLNTSNATLSKQNKMLEEDAESTKQEVGDITAEKKKLKQIAAEALSYVNQKTKLSEDKTYQEIASNLLKDTGIKTTIIREYLPAMNKLINMYLSAMDFYVHFELDEAFNEVIKSRHRDEFTYASFSEGEKMRIDLAILFTWRQIAKMKNSVNTNLLVLDEIFDSSLDVAGTDYFLSVMNTLGDKSNVFVISHKGDQLYDKFHSVIKFEKKNDFSVISGA